MTANSINTSPKRRSMKLRMDDPKKYNNAATAKKRRDLAAMALAKKIPKGIAVHPDMIVITLNGKGVTPATSTAQSP